MLAGSRVYVIWYWSDCHEKDVFCLVCDGTCGVMAMFSSRASYAQGVSGCASSGRSLPVNASAAVCRRTVCGQLRSDHEYKAWVHQASVVRLPDRGGLVAGGWLATPSGEDMS